VSDNGMTRRQAAAHRQLTHVKPIDPYCINSDRCPDGAAVASPEPLPGCWTGPLPLGVMAMSALQQHTRNDDAGVITHQRWADVQGDTGRHVDDPKQASSGLGRKSARFWLTSWQSVRKWSNTWCRCKPGRGGCPPRPAGSACGRTADVGAARDVRAWARCMLHVPAPPRSCCRSGGGAGVGTGVHGRQAHRKCREPLPPQSGVCMPEEMPP
jgi:hypothetical protein